MKNNYVKLQANTNKEKQLLSNVINEITEVERKNRKQNSNDQIDTSEVLENNTSFCSDYAELEILPLMNRFTVETTFVSGYGNFLWNVPKGIFDKTPLRRIRRDDPKLEVIDEDFEIEFVCEEVLLSKEEVLKKLGWFENNEPTFNIYSKKKIVDISFNVNKNSSLTYSQLLFSLINESDRIHWGLRKDYHIYPTKSERKHFPYDLSKSFELANKRLNDYWGGIYEEDDSDFIEKLFAA